MTEDKQPAKVEQPKAGSKEEKEAKTLQQAFDEYCELNPGAVECREFDL